MLKIFFLLGNESERMIRIEYCVDVDLEFYDFFIASYCRIFVEMTYCYIFCDHIFEW